MGICDLDAKLVKQERLDFLPLLKWIETCGEGFTHTLSGLTSRRVLGWPYSPDPHKIYPIDLHPFVVIASHIPKALEI